MKNQKVLWLTQMGVLAAIMVVFAFTPLGYLKTAGIEISFMMLPVVIGAIICGPLGGAVLGGLFGITSFIQCFGTSAFGVFVLSLNPVFTFIICMIPRILAGWLAGIIYKAICKKDKSRYISVAISSFSGALLNTIFFMGGIILLFWNNDSFTSKMTEWGMAVNSIWAFVVAFVGINGVVEACVCFVVGSAIGRGLIGIINSKKSA